MSRWNDAPGPRRADRLALVLMAATALAFATFSASRPAEAAPPQDQVLVPVGGSALGGLTTNPALSPLFSVNTHDYVIRCGVGLNVVSLHLIAATGTIQAGGQSGATVDLSVNLGEGQAAVVGSSANQYWIRCLPHDFPVLQIANQHSPPPGWYLTGNITSSTTGPASGLYAMILDNNGTPVWYQAAPGGAINVEQLPGNNIAWIPSVGPGLGSDPNGAFGLYNLDSQTTSSVRAPLPPTDPHELLQLANGNRMLIGSPAPIGQAFVDCVLQEVNPQGGLVWSWKASDHISLTESTRAQPVNYNGRQVQDVYHCNSIDVDQTTGNVLLSVRHTDAVYLINKVSKNVIWKMGGNTTREAGAVYLNIVNPADRFYAQHDARFRPNGDISLYDDHSQQATGNARGVEYAINPGAGTATLNFSYQNGPISNATGSFRRNAVGTDNIVGWGIRGGSGFDEFDATGGTAQGLLMTMRFPNGESEYRVVKVDPSALDVNLLRSTAGLPRPVSPSTLWQPLGGVLTSRPAAASWSPDRLDAFVRGSDQQTWHIWSSNGQWSGWEPLGGSLTSGPGVASWSAGRLDVFVRGSDQQLWHQWFDGNHWSGWEPLGGVLASSPSAASWSGGRLDVVVEGSDQQVWHRWFDGNQWNGWEPLGGQTNADPAVASWSAGRLDIFVRNLEGTLGHRFYEGQWSPWEWFAGSLTSGPSATSAFSGQLDVVGGGVSGVPQRFEYSSGWRNWQSLGGATTQTPAATRRDSLNEDVFVTGTDGQLYHTALSSAPGFGAATRQQAAPSRQAAPSQSDAGRL
ncbi:aryl-sulfate sulfotransferase [Candidatus Nephthysia bennettiae]|uniref:Aryl-sulfate sulfotransferase n=1 Tax=Candidatus Nephthysia bennettiae TaxID=3127016 RepID=A0A934NBJ1_9BACT|nr:aryl-sulfate sulfotransferase [Candidatus Dormibacteraeota bacterium]MBJ7613301.1 aryl-sulfate sulfotransferase [Candidatus Dormibacteraeota bacterium]